MGIYISSKGEEKDTATMAYPYLQAALNKAVAEQNDDNVRVLQAELQQRDGANTVSGLESGDLGDQAE